MRITPNPPGYPISAAVMAYGPSAFAVPPELASRGFPDSRDPVLLCHGTCLCCQTGIAAYPDAVAGALAWRGLMDCCPDADLRREPGAVACHLVPAPGSVFGNG